MLSYQGVEFFELSLRFFREEFVFVLLANPAILAALGLAMVDSCSCDCDGAPPVGGIASIAARTLSSISFISSSATVNTAASVVFELFKSHVITRVMTSLKTS